MRVYQSSGNCEEPGMHCCVLILFYLFCCLDTESNKSWDCFAVIVHHTQFISLRQRAPKVPCNYPPRRRVRGIACLSPSTRHVPWAAASCSPCKLPANAPRFLWSLQNCSSESKQIKLIRVSWICSSHYCRPPNINWLSNQSSGHTVAVWKEAQTSEWLCGMRLWHFARNLLVV